ncbi:MAG: aminotransferase class V-fold PLP-dependent enzyme [Bacteroidetes bacterium]|nr:MAG: aminotransferase class V-fold PLP-dependent enzyme [Bacteroidota bacterium]
MSSRRRFLKQGFLASNALVWTGFNTEAGIPMPLQSRLEDKPEAYWTELRKQFPLKAGHHFLNNGTMGPSPMQVIKAVQDSELYLNTEAKYGGWEETFKPLSAYVGAQEEELCLTRNVTEGINIIAWGLDLKSGDEIIVSNHEHVGNALPWLNRARVDKLNVKVLDYNLSDDALLEQLKKLITPKTKLIAIPHIPCTTGRIMPVKEIGEIAKKNNILYFLDGAHGAGMTDLNFAELNCDFYASCTHKWMLGPKGTGFLLIKKDKLDLVDPRFVGGYSDKGWTLLTANPHIEEWQDKAARYFYGTQNPSLYKGVVSAVDFLNEIGKTKVVARIKQLNDHLYSKLEEVGGLDILTPKNAHAGIVSFRIPGKDFNEAYRHFHHKHFIVRAVPECDVNCIRVSTHIYNSFQEIDSFAETLKEYR